eukprot:1940854-Pleurochrysis_carterae.AAC.1
MEGECLIDSVLSLTVPGSETCAAKQHEGKEPSETPSQQTGELALRSRAPRLRCGYDVGSGWAQRNTGTGGELATRGLPCCSFRRLRLSTIAAVRRAAICGLCREH